LTKTAPKQGSASKGTTTTTTTTGSIYGRFLRA
jgi:hypothetical protein